MTQLELEQTQKFIELMDNPWFFAAFMILLIWSLIWKGIAMWKAARNSHKAWFIALLVVNTVGILEIIYVFFFGKKKESQSQNNLKV